MIFVLRKIYDYNETYFMDKYKTKQDALDAISCFNGYLTDYIFIEGQELQFSLESEG